MLIATASLEGTSPYSQSRHHETPKEDKESSADYEKRTWRERLHVDKTGHIYVPPMALKNCLAEAAKYLSISIPGKGKSTYTKHIEAGVIVVEPIPLPIKKEDVPGEWLFVPSDGKRGGSSRVSKCFGCIQEWSGAAQYLVLDMTITKDVFAKVLEEAGKFIGIGRFRPRNNGFYGRFKVNSITWSEG